MIIFRKLVVPNILRIVVTYHSDYQATGHNVSIWYNATANNLFKPRKMTLYYIFNNKNMKVEWQKCGEGLS